MYDLGILQTPFARVVLGVAVVEDVVLYVVLAVAISLATHTGGPAFGLPAFIHLTSGSTADIAYHVAMTLLVLALFLVAAWWRQNHRPMWQGRVPLLNLSPAAGRVMLLLATALMCLFLGVETFLGAFAAGVAVGARHLSGGGTPAGEDAHQTVPLFSYAFFIPVYFASVGINLNLRHGFDVLFFAWFLVFACVAKAFAVYLGARLGGLARNRAVNLAFALNARGGPGIVLASVSYSAHIINGNFYTCLLLLSMITSLGAGSWLERVPKHAFTDDNDTTPDTTTPGSVPSPTSKQHPLPTPGQR
jgi:Kef-type K+ transport system membrane component KefB